MDHTPTSILDATARDLWLESRESATSLMLQSLQQAPDGVVLVDPDGHVALFDQAASTSWKLPPSQVVGQPLQVLFPAAVCERILDQPQAREHVPVEFELAGAQVGQTTPVSVTTSIVAHGQHRLHLCFVRDVSAQRQQEAHARLLSQALNHSSNAIVICDRDSHVVHVNEGSRRMFATRPKRWSAAGPATRSQATTPIRRSWSASAAADASYCRFRATSCSTTRMAGRSGLR